MIQDFQSRKQDLIEQLKELNKKEAENIVSTEDYHHKKREIERELVEIMDRLTQLGYLLKK